MAKVLVVDRDPPGCDGIIRALSGDGHQVDAVSDGIGALRTLAHGVPDLLLIDQGVPAGGLRTAEILRQSPRFGSVRILLGVEAGPQAAIQALLKRGVGIGVNGIVVRPYDGEGVRRKVRELCSGERDESRRLVAQDRRVRSVEVRQQVRNMRDLPTLSPAHQRIIAIMSSNDEDIDVDALAEAVQSDQALTVRVMRIARTAYYGFQGSFIRTAITFLGMARVRQIVQSATILEVFDRQTDSELTGFDRRSAWVHSLACGMVMQRISRDGRQGRHFTAGLLHDVGKLVLDFRFREVNKVIHEVAKRDQRPVHAVESEMLGVTHMEIGQDLGSLWQLPGEVVEAIVFHHEPCRALRHKQLSALVYLADVAVRQMGLGHAGNGAPPAVEDPYASRLHIDLDGVVAQKEELTRQLDAVIAPESA